MSASRPAAPAQRIAVPAGTTCADAVAATKLPATGPNAIIAVRAPDASVRDLSWIPDHDVDVEPVPLSSPDGLKVLRHSTAHVLAQAVRDLFPAAKLGIGSPMSRTSWN